MENKEIIIITKPLKNFLTKTKQKLNYNFVFTNTQQFINIFINNNNNNVIIYDITESPSKIKTISIKNHINKTGTNPLIKNQKKLKIDFLDITSIYSCKIKKGKTTTSLGKKYNKHKNRTKTPSTDLANIAILCKALKFKKIKAKLINTTITN